MSRAGPIPHAYHGRRAYILPPNWACLHEDPSTPYVWPSILLVRMNLLAALAQLSLRYWSRINW
jgi:hypothetical protein